MSSIYTPCPQCNAVNRVDPAMADELTFVKLDTESDPAAASRHRIQAIPTLLILQDGRESARQSGAMDAASFRRWLSSFTRDPEVQT